MIENMFIRRSSRVRRGWAEVSAAVVETLERRQLLSGGIDTTWGNSGTAFEPILQGSAAATVGGVARTATGGTIAVSTSNPGYPNGSVITVSSYLANGTLNPAFGNAGTDNLVVGLEDEGNAVAIQADGKILIAGASGSLGPNGSDNAQNYRFTVIRLNSNGAMDTTFGGSGEVFLNFETTFACADGIAVNGTGQIIAVGSTGNAANGSNSNFAVAMLNANGSPDTAFNGSGMATTTFTQGASQAESVTLDSSGRPVVSGALVSGYNLIARYTLAGTLDTTFNTSGYIVEPANVGFAGIVPGPGAVTTDSSGHIDYTTFTGEKNGGFDGGLYGFQVIQYTSGGAVNNSFAAGGTASWSMATAGIPTSQGQWTQIGQTSTGSLVVGAAITTYPNTSNTTNYSTYVISTALSSSGMIESQSSSLVAAAGAVGAAAIGSDGSVTFAGVDSTNNNYLQGPGLVITRLNTANVMDSTFGTNGVVTTPDQAPVSAWAAASLLQPNGNLVIGGFDPVEVALARFNASGSIDSSFGTNGQSLSAINYLNTSAMALQPDGDLLVAGPGAVARYTPAGGLDSTFGSGGVVQLAYSGSFGNLALAVLPNGQILVGDENKVLRLNSNGSTDTTFAAAGSFSASSLSQVSAVSFAVNGDILLAGLFSTGAGVMALLPAGNIDTSFGANGFSPTISNASVGTMTVEPNGSIVVAGSVVARFTSTGQLDTTFNATGIYPSAAGTVTSTQILSNGDILLGSLDNGINLTELMPDGIPDSAFGTNGSVNDPSPAGFIIPSATTYLGLAVRANGNIVVSTTAEQISGGPPGFLAVQFAANTPPASGAEAVNVASGQTYHFNSSGSSTVSVIGVDGLNIQSSGTAAIAAAVSAYSRQLLVVNGTGLGIAGSVGEWTGLLNLNNNDLDLPGASLATITNQISEGRNNGAWTGAGGIISGSAAINSTHLTALGIIENNQGGTPLYSTTNLFDGNAPGLSDILVKYTYYGDSNLDGKVDASDYARIDNGFVKHLTGWFNGDFNYDGIVDGSDYALIDNSFNTQDASLAVQIALIKATKPSASRFRAPSAVISQAWNEQSWSTSGNVASITFPADLDDQKKKVILFLFH